MSHIMKLNSNIETFIFLQNGNMLEVVIDFNKGTCVVYSSMGGILIKREKMSPLDMNMLKGRISNYIANGKRLRGYKRPPFGGLII